MDKPWGPDLLLTDGGTEQAHNVNSIWKQELSSGIAFPSGNNAAVAPKALIKEVRNYEIGNYYQHTCNMRRTRSFIKETYPQFEIEEGFTEDSLGTRVREGLDEIFEKDKSWYISITAHALTNRAIREVLGATVKKMPTGGVFAMVISITPTSEQP